MFAGYFRHYTNVPWTKVNAEGE